MSQLNFIVLLCFLQTSKVFSQDTRTACGLNERYSDCGTECQPTCENKFPICTLQCVTGCFCGTGYVRQNGKCIPETQCPGCSTNEVLNPCPQKCSPPELNCSQVFQGTQQNCLQYPPVRCAPKCICQPGFVRNSFGKCVENCCPDPNSELTEYPFNCCPGGVCEMRWNSRCTTPCPKRACKCKPGFLKRNFFDPTCVPSNTCYTYGFGIPKDPEVDES